MNKLPHNEAGFSLVAFMVAVCLCTAGVIGFTEFYGYYLRAQRNMNSKDSLDEIDLGLRNYLTQRLRHYAKDECPTDKFKEYFSSSQIGAWGYPRVVDQAIEVNDKAPARMKEAAARCALLGIPGASTYKGGHFCLVIERTEENALGGTFLASSRPFVEVRVDFQEAHQFLTWSCQAFAGDGALAMVSYSINWSDGQKEGRDVYNSHYGWFYAASK